MVEHESVSGGLTGGHQKSEKIENEALRFKQVMGSSLLGGKERFEFGAEDRILEQWDPKG